MEQAEEGGSSKHQMRRWELTAHACRFCFGRVLQRTKRGKVIEVLCAECHQTAPGEPSAICCCGADCGALGRALECFSNPERSEANPQVIMVRECARGPAAKSTQLQT
jgi:hypothetical protein